MKKVFTLDRGQLETFGAEGGNEPSRTRLPLHTSGSNRSDYIGASIKFLCRSDASKIWTKAQISNREPKAGIARFAP